MSRPTLIYLTAYSLMVTLVSLVIFVFARPTRPQVAGITSSPPASDSTPLSQ